MARNSRGLPTCITVQPEVLVHAVLGALGRRTHGAILTARAVRDHRELLSPEVCADLTAAIRGWLNGPGARHAAVDRAPWVVALNELRRPTLAETADARRKAWGQLGQPDRRRPRPAGARS